MDGTVITTALWVPRGCAAPFPTKYTFDDAEFERIAGLAKLQLDDAKEDLQEAQEKELETEVAEEGKEVGESKKKEKKKKKQGITEDEELDDDLKEYDLEHYDEDDEDMEGEGQGASIFGNIKSLAYYESNTEDPYITLKDVDEDEDEERADLQILTTDNLLLAAKVEDELAHLEVYVYEDEADNLYVHHDIMLPAIPLCLERLDFAVGKADVEPDSTANFVAIGTVDPEIEIWDLDTVDCMYPNAILGGDGKQDGASKKPKKKKKKSKKPNDEYHVGSVLALAANRHSRNLLASASADKTVKLWDLNTAKCAKSYGHHTDKVCSLAWHAVEAAVLLSGSYDRTVVVADMRAPDLAPPRWTVESDVETVQWDPHDSNCFFVSTEGGMIHYYDVRNNSSGSAKSQTTRAVWKLQAHDESVPCFDVNRVIPGFMATGSTDKTVKLWNIQPTGPTMVVSRNFDVGNVFAATFAPDPEVAFRLAVGGSKGTISVWDTSTNAAVRRAFAHKISTKPNEDREVEDKLIGVDDDEDEGSSEDEEEESGAALNGDEGEWMDEDEAEG